ncbi:MAG: non-ribosomal peptide synthetase, partial [Hydrogenophaga sp.]
IRQWCDLNATADLTHSTVLFEPMPLQRSLQDLLGPQRRVELHEQASSALSLLAYGGESLALQLEFDPDRVRADAARRLLASVARLLDAMAHAAPLTPLAALRSTSDEELAALARWAEPDPPAPAATACVATQIARQAAATPMARAVVCAASGNALSYEALDRAASRLAAWLTQRGVGPGQFVALCLPRGLQFVTSLLAVMKSGAAWLPIDPGYPAELVNHMVADSQVRLVLTERSVPLSFDAVDAVVLEDLEAACQALDPGAPEPPWPLDRPAYVIYTSGSTGKPKGVVVSHRALASHAQAVAPFYGLQATDRVLQFASLSFDVSIEEIVPTLVSGAELVLRHTAAAESVSGFLQLVQDHKLTVLNLPTAFWHTCAEQMYLGGQRLPASVRLLVVGGEKASRRELELWRSIHPELRWVNAYGPTEATISCCAFDLPAHSPLPPGPDVPIGRPLGHARLAVLAPDGALAPPGARGTLCLGGPGLADGYLGQPSLTAERFPPAATATVDPALAAWQWSRLYRAGDDARWDSSGQLRFLGRQDREIKVRGFRVDLRAVEHALERLPAVAQAVVRLDRPGEPGARLLAWVLPAVGETPTVQALQADLARVLPGHMRPAIQLVSTWPTTPGGKIDLARLPLHAPARVEPASPQALPDDLRRMTALFARVLECAEVAPDDSFFDLGGNSLLALRLMARIESEFGACGGTMGVGLLKTHATPASLLAAMRSTARDALPRHLVAIQGEGSGVPLYGIHGLGHRERLYRPLASALGPGLPVFGLTVGYADLAQPLPSLEELAAQYLQDIQAHRPTGPLVLAGLSHSGYVAFELAHQLTRAGREVARLVLFDSQGPGGRPELRGRKVRLRAHATKLRKRGVGYLPERVVQRLSYRGGLAGRVGFLLAKALGGADSLGFDQSADV